MKTLFEEKKQSLSFCNFKSVTISDVPKIVEYCWAKDKAHLHMFILFLGTKSGYEIQYYLDNLDDEKENEKQNIRAVGEMKMVKKAH